MVHFRVPSRDDANTCFNTIETVICIGLFPIIGIGIGIGFKLALIIGIGFGIGKFLFWTIDFGIDIGIKIQRDF